jgi:hypothetical protein
LPPTIGDYTALAKNYPTPQATAGIVFDDDWGRLSEEAFLRDFGGDLPPEEARVLYAVQQPFKKSLTTEKTTSRHSLARRHGAQERVSAGQPIHDQSFQNPLNLSGAMSRQPSRWTSVQSVLGWARSIRRPLV